MLTCRACMMIDRKIIMLNLINKKSITNQIQKYIIILFNNFILFDTVAFQLRWNNVIEKIIFLITF